MGLNKSTVTRALAADKPKADKPKPEPKTPKSTLADNIEGLQAMPPDDQDDIIREKLDTLDDLIKRRKR
ncbi:hypothetical protein [Prosthecomicrobium sp. N25]|uniref:hypothetical protein n=1 Tax=Prosthecomicrobium sp. N25 TaxID=3129254 RepID=UPI003076FBE1